MVCSVVEAAIAPALFLDTAPATSSMIQGDAELNPIEQVSRVVVLDTDPTTRDCIPVLFGAERFETVETDTSHDSSKILMTGRVDLILLSVDWFNGKSMKQSRGSTREMVPQTNDTLVQRLASLRKHDPHLPVIVLLDKDSANTDTLVALLAAGATGCIAKPLLSPSLAALMVSALESRRLLRVPVLSSPINNEPLLPIIGKCESMLAVYRGIGLIASTCEPVMIRGEIGTGKSLVAEVIHRHGNPAGGAMNVIRGFDLSFDRVAEHFKAGSGNCNVANSHTPATIVVDGIERCSLEVQYHLLDWIRSTRRYTPRHTDLSPRLILISTLHSVSENSSGPHIVLPELFYELAGGLIELPPLRDRCDDLVLLLDHFMSRLSGAVPMEGASPSRISSDAVQMMRSYAWPGNVSELQSVVRAALVRGNGIVTGDRVLRHWTQRLTHGVRASSYSLHGNVVRQPEAIDRKANGSEVQSPLVGLPYVQLRYPEFWNATVDRLLEENSRAGNADETDLNDEQLHDELTGMTETLYTQSVEAVEVGLISAVLRKTGGNLAQSARLLGMSRVRLRKKIHLLGLVVPGRGTMT